MEIVWQERVAGLTAVQEKRKTTGVEFKKVACSNSLSLYCETFLFMCELVRMLGLGQHQGGTYSSGGVKGWGISGGCGGIQPRV